ncbi:MAG: efflux RND transporter periplasmic adaptor subunit [Caldilineaceae bacterium]|nr:efflux RND transporter periplasmic adaptor subunit [Caldilineaceae bacterium]
MNRKYSLPLRLTPGVALIFSLFLLAGCGFLSPPTPTPVPTLAPAISQPVSRVARAAGTIVPVRKALLGLTSPGRVASMAVDVGDQVQAGDLLVQLEESGAQAQLAQAQAALLRAQANLAGLQADPQPAQVAAAQARLDGAQAHLDQLTLDRLLTPATPSQLAEARALVASAQAGLDLLNEAALPSALAAGEALIAEAMAGVQSAQAALANTALRAPFAGTVTALQIALGEMALPGQPVVTLADLSRLQVETTDLSERDLARVSVGTPVTIFVDALGQEITGRVTRVALQASIAGGDVVYPLIIELDEQPAALRWGMSVDVEVRSP